MKRPPAGPGNPGGQCRRDVSAMVVGQGIEMDEYTGTDTVLMVIAPQEAHLHHLNPVDDAPLPQDGSAACRSSGQGCIVGSLRPPRRGDAKRATVLGHRSRSQLSPPCLRHSRLIATHPTHDADSTATGPTATQYRIHSDPAMGGPHHGTNGRLALFRGGWHRVVTMTHIVLTATTASGAQALAVMCGAQMCCCQAC